MQSTLSVSLFNRANFQRFSGFHFGQVSLFEGDALQGRPPFPANPLKLRFGAEVIYIAQAEVLSAEQV
jgi:hypothetical protein